jgi:hypothetical protein
MSDYLDDLRKLALRAVLKPDAQAFMRNISRWFSKAFSTPLYEVESLPKEYILEHYFESLYEAMDDEEKHNQIIHLLESPEERRARAKAEKDDEAELLAEMEKEAASAPDGVDLRDLARKFQRKSLRPPLPEIPDDDMSIKFDEIPD